MTAPRSEKLSLGMKIIYGAPSFAGAAMAIPVAVHMPKFYTDAVLVPLGWVALAMALARVFDAILDPFVGWLSDHTHSRWGRRRPWIAVAAPLAALAFIALFTPPAALDSTEAAIWFGTTLMLFFMLQMVYSLPHGALGAELTLDYHERSSLFSVREAFALVGTLLASIAPSILHEMLHDPRREYAIMALIYAALMIGLYWLLVGTVRERPDFARRESNPLVPGVRRALRNRPFFILFACYIVASIPGAIPGLLMPYFNEYVIQPENPERWLGIFLLTYFGAGLVCLPLWLMASRRFGKLNTWLASFVMGITGGLAMFFLGKGDTLGLFLLIAWSGSSFGAGLFLPPAIQADVTDYDELHTGKRREAQYLAFWGLVPKFIVIPSASIPLSVLAWLGYAPNQPQTPEVILAIKAIFALTPAAFSIAAFFIAWRFPISESVHREILNAIEAHKRGDPAIDPLTGQVVMPPGDKQVDEKTGWFLDNFSHGELVRVLRDGPQRALGDVLRVGVGSFALALGLAIWVVYDLAATGGNPGPFAVLAIVISGFSFTAFAFHLMRVRPALQLRSASLPAETLRAHLELANGSGVIAARVRPASASQPG